MNDFLDRPRAARGTGVDGGGSAIGIDLGGTNLRSALFRGIDSAIETGIETLTCVREERVAVGSARDPHAIVSRLAELISEIRRAGESPEIPVGIGFAGMLEGRDGFVVNSPHLGWREVPFGRLVREALGDANVGVWNDVNAITYAEYKLGAAADADDVLAVFVGTGIGAGLIAGGQLIEGSRGCAAEIGHTKVVLDETALPCACGLRGCVEAYVGGNYLQRRARGELRGGARSLAVSIAGGIDNVNPGHLDQAAARGDDYSLDLYAEIAPLLGAALANAVTLLNPSHLILGGGMLSRTPVLRDHVALALEVAVNPPAAAGLVIAEAALGDRAGTIGAALLAHERYGL